MENFNNDEVAKMLEMLKIQAECTTNPEKEVTQALWYAIMGTTLRDLRTLAYRNDYADKDDNKPTKFRNIIF